MECEILPCCQFFKEKMKDLPKAAEYIRDRICRDNYQSCNRFRIYREYGKEHIPGDLDPDDIMEAKRIIECLRNRAEREANSAA